LLFVFSAAWIRDVLYWFPKDAFGTSLNYWAYTDWLIDYSQGFIRRGLSGEFWRLVPGAVSPLEFVAAFSWILILAVAFGYVRMLARSWKIYHPLTLFGLLFLPSLFVFLSTTTTPSPGRKSSGTSQCFCICSSLKNHFCLETASPFQTGICDAMCNG
jgi:hypothetical protein